MLAQSKRLNYIEGNLNQFINNSDTLSKTLDLVSRLRNNWGWLFVGREQKIGQIDTSLTDFDSVTMLGFQIVAAISGVQSARLLETSPKGWQSSGSLEDKNYSKLLLSIQNADFCPILNMHYKLLAKSLYDIEKEYTCVFEPIDTPTEKERAEIKEINSRTDMNYIQAGVVSPDEVRGVLREDVNSGYNALSEEMEETENPFNDFGGSSNEQNPFKSLDEWNESEHPRDDEGKFSSTGGGNSNGSKEEKQEKTSRNVQEVIEKAKQAEPKITKDLQEITKSTGAELTGLDHRLKSEASIKNKIERDRAENPEYKNLTDKEVASRFYDTVRYTQITKKGEDLTKNIETTLDKLQQKGHTISKIKNKWLTANKNNPYRDVMAQMISPSGQKYELQFHDKANFAIKEPLHKTYEKWRDVENTDKVKAQQYSNEMKQIAKGYKTPKGIEKITKENLINKNHS
ncbi:MAG: DUF1073 domain-containing protein [Candidatus Gastranaerophilales bacterium]|nr:DUF1073 domain-containing protein [Candidatus Gastranaerophilales bacterium]